MTLPEQSWLQVVAGLDQGYVLRSLRMQFWRVFCPIDEKDPLYMTDKTSIYFQFAINSIRFPRELVWSWLF